MRTSLGGFPSKNGHVVLSGTPEHRNTGTSRNIREQPKNLEHPEKTRNTPKKTRNTPRKPGTPQKKPGTPQENPEHPEKKADGAPICYRLRELL